MRKSGKVRRPLRPPIMTLDGLPISFADGGPGVPRGQCGATYSGTGAPRRLHPERWCTKRCIREFASYIRGGSTEEIKDAMDRLDCWRECIAQFTRGPGPDDAIGGALLAFWNDSGLTRIPRGLKGDLPVFVDALRHHLPVYVGHDVTLYRGEDEARHRAGMYGIAWTSDPEVAEMFASRRKGLGEPEGVVLRIEASPEMIVVGPTESSLWQQEHEYIVNPRLIRSVVTVSPDALTP